VKREKGKGKKRVKNQAKVSAPKKARVRQYDPNDLTDSHNFFNWWYGASIR